MHQHNVFSDTRKYTAGKVYDFTTKEVQELVKWLNLQEKLKSHTQQVKY